MLTICNARRIARSPRFLRADIRNERTTDKTSRANLGLFLNSTRNLFATPLANIGTEPVNYPRDYQFSMQRISAITRVTRDNTKRTTLAFYPNLMILRPLSARRKLQRLLFSWAPLLQAHTVCARGQSCYSQPMTYHEREPSHPIQKATTLAVVTETRWLSGCACQRTASVLRQRMSPYVCWISAVSSGPTCQSTSSCRDSAKKDRLPH
jgi:hypothetical protein